MKRKSQMFTFIFFIIVAAIIILVAAVTVPAGKQFTVQIYEQSEVLFLQANATASTIQDSTMRTSMVEDYTAAFNSSSTNELIVLNMFGWTWLILLILIAIAIYIKTFNTATVNQRGFV